MAGARGAGTLRPAEDASAPAPASAAAPSSPPAPASATAPGSARLRRFDGRTLRIGLTGPIGCGKSTVAAWLGELGAVVIDADRVAREVTAPGTPALEAITSAFGRQLVLSDGSLDRAALGRIVFADPTALSTLEAIVHPAVRPMILEALEAAERDGAPAIAIEAIKLVEGGLGELCDEIWLITCAPDAQLERLRARLGAQHADPADADARVAAQEGLVERLTPLATRVLDTSADVGATRRLVEAVYEDALRRSTQED